MSMFTYAELTAMIPARSRNTEAQDIAFAETIVNAVLERLQSASATKPSLEDVEHIVHPHAMPTEGQGLEQLMWLATRIWAARPNRELPIQIEDSANIILFGIHMPFPIGAQHDFKRHELVDKLKFAFSLWESGHHE